MKTEKQLSQHYDNAPFKPTISYYIEQMGIEMPSEELDYIDDTFEIIGVNYDSKKKPHSFQIKYIGKDSSILLTLEKFLEWYDEKSDEDLIVGSINSKHFSELSEAENESLNK